MIARAIALASVLGEDEAPLDALPEPYPAAARLARERLLRGNTGARAVAVARETVALFAHAAPPSARRLLPAGLVTALAPPDAAAPRIALPPWLARGLGVSAALGLSALSRATSGQDPAATAEILRRLSAGEAAAVLSARRTPVDPADAARSRTLLLFARGDERVDPIAHRVGLFRLAWAASIEPGALAALAAALPGPEGDVVLEAGHALWFAAGEGAAAERVLVDQDLEERS